jgi:hypothetical protein
LTKRDNGDIAVSGFETNASGRELPVRACQAIAIDDILIAMDDDSIEDDRKTWTLYRVMEHLITASVPLRLTFRRQVPWECLKCTLINDIAQRACVACGNLRQKNGTSYI